MYFGKSNQTCYPIDNMARTSPIMILFFRKCNVVLKFLSVQQQQMRPHTNTHRDIVLDGVCPACGRAVRHRWLPFTFHWILCVLLYADVFIIKFPRIFIYIFCVALRYALCLSPPCAAFTSLPSLRDTVHTCATLRSSSLRTASLPSLPFFLSGTDDSSSFSHFSFNLSHFTNWVSLSLDLLSSLCFCLIPFHILLRLLPNNILCSSLDSTRAQLA